VGSVSKSEREQREAENEARRARRLADRAEERARRKADNASKATQRADELARRANRRKGPRDRALESSIEDYVDDVAEKWTHKAEVWMDEQSSKFLDQSAAKEYSGYDDSEEGDDDSEYGTHAASGRNRNRRHDDSSTRSRSSRRRRKVSTWKSLVRRKISSNRGLYRDKDRKRVCGVCAGLADYWNMETWKIRFAAVMGFFFIPSLTIPGYFILYFLMDDKPYYRKASERYEGFHVDGESDSAKKSKQGGLQSRRTRTKSDLSNVAAFSSARNKFANLEARVRLIEAHVTSSKFELQREFKKISGDEL
jgi:phage shock protein C